jgi:hypothetical protein
VVAVLDPEQVRNDALCFFRESAIPDRWSWVNSLSPVNLRLFAVELADAIKQSAITGDPGALTLLVAAWQATAELDASPAVLAEVKRPKRGLPLSHFTSV